MKDLGKYYKSKYLALRAQYIKTIDFAFREGYLKGTEEAQMQQAQQQAQEAQMQAQQAQQMQMAGQAAGAAQPSGQEGMPQEGMPQEGTPPEGQMYDQSPEEMDSLINELQQAIQKSETEQPSLQKSLDKLVQLKNQKKSMGYANHLGHVGKLALSEQEKLVANLVKKWDNESSDAASKMMSALRSESVKG